LGKYRVLWTEIAPLDEVRDKAEQLLGKYDLRAAAQEGFTVVRV
jgi:hypothetical protein